MADITIGSTSHHHKKHQWKLIMVVVVLGAIAGIAFLGEGTPTGFFSSLPGVELLAGEQTISLSATIDKFPISANGDFDEIILVYDTPNSALRIDKNQLDVIGDQTLEVKISDFKGKVSLDALNPRLVSIDGEASRFYVNGIGQTSEKSTDLVAHGLEVRSLSLNGATLPAFSASDISGSASFNGGKVTFTLDTEPFEFGPFTGNVQVLESGLVQLDGTTSYVKSKGLDIGDELNSGTGTITTVDTSTDEPKTIAELGVPLSELIEQEVEAQLPETTEETTATIDDSGMRYVVEGFDNDFVQTECIDIGLSKGECEDFLGVEE